jgi:hypothetical protein
MLFSDEKRCPRCGAALHDDRREHDRRILDRRQGPVFVPAEGERRAGERRQRKRRVKGN